MRISLFKLILQNKSGANFPESAPDKYFKVYIKSILPVTNSYLFAVIAFIGFHLNNIHSVRDIRHI